MKQSEINVSEKYLVWGFIIIYLVLCAIWEFSSIAPWDDDCVTRYFNVRAAMHNPVHFIDLWNRPLFIILFFIPFSLGKHAVLFMAIISASGAYALYKTAKILKMPNAFLIFPLLFFQAFYFTISRSSLAEPLAAAIICFGYFFYVRKKFLYFAIIGSLIPLARLELSVVLVIWIYILFINKKWKYILVFIIPPILWSLAASVLKGDMLWLYEKTIGAENVSNRYGHTGFEHYFQRYIYIVGPIVFYFFTIGFWEKVFKRKFDFFLIPQFVLVFMIYVVFSWKLNMGQAAGFLRHLITISPLAAIIALYGYNYWINAIDINNISLPPSSKINLGKTQSIIQTKHKKNILNDNHEKKTEYSREKNAKWRILIYSILMIILAYFFFSKKLISYQIISGIDDFKNIIVIGFFTLLFILLIIIFRKRTVMKWVKYTLSVFVILSLMAYTLITEPPDSHYSIERRLMTKISDSYLKNNFIKYKTYVNHRWFFWANDFDYESDNFLRINRKNLDNAPDSSLIIWESHYSKNIEGGDCLNYILKKQEFVELLSEKASDSSIIVVLFQKIKNQDTSRMMDFYNRIIRLFPYSQTTYLNKAKYELNTLKNSVAAIKDLDIYIKKDSDNAEVFFNRGISYARLKENSSALKDFKKATKLNPKFVDAHYNLGVCMGLLNDFNSAIDEFSVVIKLKNDYGDAYFARGTTFANINNNEKAIDDFTKYISLNPNNSNAYLNRGKLFFRLGKTYEGCQNLFKAKQLGCSQIDNLISQHCK